MPLERETELFRREQKNSLLTDKEREALLQPYLPKTRSEQQKARQLRKQKPIRTFILDTIHFLLYTLIHIVYSIYARIRYYYRAVRRRIRAVLYYHHRTPELIRRDIKGLSRLPQHLSIILDLPKQENRRAALETLLDNVAEVSAWCACAGIPLLSVYERTGIMKSCIEITHKTVAIKLHAYFGPKRPSLQVRAPHTRTFLDGDTSEDHAAVDTQANALGHLNLLLISEDDGRNTMVDLTKTLAEMVQNKKIAAQDINPELIDAEISESVMDEPDLLMLFSPEIKLQGYPPWPIRLTEVFHEPDNNEVLYTVWLKGLHRYARAEMRFGR